MLAGRLGRFGEAGDVLAAIERPDGRLVDALLQAGHPVVPVKPNTIKTWRESEVASGAKSDAGELPAARRPAACQGRMAVWILDCAIRCTW